MQGVVHCQGGGVHRQAHLLQLLQDFGAVKLSAVDPKDYAALKAKAEVL